MRGRRPRSKNGFQSVFEAPELLCFRVYPEKIENEIYEGVAVAGSPTAGSATGMGLGNVSSGIKRKNPDDDEEPDDAVR